MGVRSEEIAKTNSSYQIGGQREEEFIQEGAQTVVKRWNRAARKSTD